MVPVRDGGGDRPNHGARRRLLRVGAGTPARRASRRSHGAALCLRERRCAPAGRLDVPGARMGRRSSPTTSRTSSTAPTRPRSSRPSTGCSGSCTRWPAFAAGRTRPRSLPVPRAARATSSSATFSTADVPALEGELSEAIARIRAGSSGDASDFACSGFPALDVVCAGPAPPRTRVVSGGAARACRTSTGTCRRSRPCSRRSTRRASTRSSVAAISSAADSPSRSSTASHPSARALRARQRRSAGARGHRRVRHRLGSRARAPRRRALAPITTWPLTVELAVDALGRTLVLPRDPSADEPIFTRITPDHAVIDLLGDVEADLLRLRTYARPVRPRAAPRECVIVNAGSVGMPVRGAPGRVLGAARPGRRPGRSTEL